MQSTATPHPQKTTAKHHPRKESKTLHFDLSHLPAAKSPPAHVLHVGTKTYAVAAHTAVSRAHHRKCNHALEHVPDERLTHYAEHIELSADGPQAYHVSCRPPGAPFPIRIVAGIHLPSDALKRAPKTLFAAKRSALGLAPIPEARPETTTGSTGKTGSTWHKERAARSVASACAAPAPGTIAMFSSLDPKTGDPGSTGDPDGLGPGEDPVDLSSWVNTTDAAVYLVFHHPELLSINSDIAAQVLAFIPSARAFAALVNALGVQGQACNLEQYQEGLTGWANAVIQKDLEGNPVLDSKGNPFWSYVNTAATSAAMTAVVQQALLAVRNTESLNGNRYLRQSGLRAISGAAASPARVTSLRANAVLLAPSGAVAPNTGYAYKLDDEDWKSGRKVEVTSTSGRTVSFTVHNSYFRHFCVFVRFRSGDPVTGPLLALSAIPSGQAPPSSALSTSQANFLSMVDAPQRLLGVPLQSDTSVDLSVLLPDAATSMEILCAGMGTGSVSDSQAIYEAVQVPGALLTGIFELAIPAFFLALGVGSQMMEEDESGFKDAVEPLVTWLIEFAAGGVARGAFAGSGFPSDGLFSSWAMDLLMSTIKAVPGAVAGLLGWATKASGEEAAEHSIPIAGQIMWAVETVGSLAEIAETVADIALSPWVIPNRITPTQNIVVTVHHDTKDGSFPKVATSYKLVATFTGITPRVILSQGTFDPMASQTVIETFAAVPSGGMVEVTAYFYSDTGWCAGRGTTGSVINLLPKGGAELDVSITITENLVPLTTATTYAQRWLLDFEGDSHAWGVTSTPPTPVDLPIQSGEVSLNALASITVDTLGRVGYSWAGISPTLASADTGQTNIELYTLQSVNSGGGNPDDALQILATGFTLPVFMAYDLLGSLTDGDFFMVTPSLDPVMGKSYYYARKVALDGAAPFDPTTATNWGRFSFDHIQQIAYHPVGVLVALHADHEKFEILKLPQTPYSSLSGAPFPDVQAAGLGANIGLCHGATALAISADGATFLVLEAVNSRIQAFNANGLSVGYFAGGESHVALTQQAEDQGKTIIYLDLAMESRGYLYVLSFVEPASGGAPAVADYRLDIYNPDGSFLSRTHGFAAARLVVDYWRNIYTLNHQLIVSSKQRPEPSVSIWVPSTPPGNDPATKTTAGT